ncbi:transcriptional regulator [Halobaculum sp. MBLA0147]|uniref:HVO_A0114 family putative DNA-binding protein n=1 Tax=Halobaculum sp. MBLA0147 TaxID=3079934 RepID=UPI0035238B17
MTQRTLVVTVGTIEDVEERAQTAFERALEDEPPVEEGPRRITFESTDELGRVFSPRAIDLLRTIAREDPASIREAARLIDRDIRDVSRNLDRLEEYDVIEYDSDGRSKRPVVPYDDIQIDLGLGVTSDPGRRQTGV